MSSTKVIVFGSTGAVGSTLVSILSEKEPTWEIHAVTRRNPSEVEKFKGLSNVKVVQGDPNDKESTMKLCADKSIVYACIGFPQYERKYWAKHWPIVVDNLLAASSQKKSQKFVFCDNLYAYGHSHSSPISVSTQTVPPSDKSKPAIRAKLRQKFQARMDKHPESIAVVGGADFFGPGVTNASFLGDTFTKAIVEEKSKPLAIGSADVIHDFCYVPDFSNALYVASVNEKANGKFWICPHAIKNKTMREISVDIAQYGKTKKAKMLVFPGWAVRLLSPFDSFMGEIVEMLPFWKKDYIIDDSAFCKTFNVTPTPYEEALKTYIEFYKSSSS